MTFTHDPAGALTGVTRNGVSAAAYTYTPRRQVSGAYLGNGGRR